MRRTRIVATIGPASSEKTVLKSLLEAGVDVCRLNYSHGTPESKTELYERIRSLEASLGRPTCILADLPGPKLRLGRFPDLIALKRGARLNLHCGVEEMVDASASDLPVEYAGLSAELNAGDPVLIADGLIRLVVNEAPGVQSGTVVCTVEDGGPVSARKGVNVPGTMVDLPAIGPNDKAAIAHALEAGADYLAVSYVRTPEDLQPAIDAVKAAGKHVPVVAKIEHPMALERLEEILDLADAVMVARGDLGVEIPLEDVPVAQQRIIDGALERGMIVIVATQMLETMTLNPRPTRAEVSDISSAIRHGATAVMLSGETASGKYPLAAVQTMAKIATAADQGFRTTDRRPSALARFKATRSVAHAGVELARLSDAERIVVATQHGNAARLVAGYRPTTPVTAVSDRIRAARRIQLLPGVESLLVKEYERGSQTMQAAVETLVEQGIIKPGQRVVAISGSPKAISGATSTVRLYKVENDGSIRGSE
ncbi:pyruvate kinase [Candidatus Poseidoniales archaeon]|nr:pyruvate kinase [Candidatus Poseidoniales archaeon]MDA8551189.1 pyruvate kinase [Candidatus Poseidoniales archaeon]MDA8557083.1 pyruvate kinase [Candidatus Poseidoniales archaeon]